MASAQVLRKQEHLEAGKKKVCISFEFRISWARFLVFDFASMLKLVGNFVCLLLMHLLAPKCMKLDIFTKFC